MKVGGLLIISVALVLAGCAESPSWTITAKETQSAWNQWTVVAGCSPTSATDCRALVTHPESWDFQVTDGSQTETVQVDRCTYENLAVGQYWNGPVCF